MRWRSKASRERRPGRRGALEGEEGRGDFRFWIFDFRLTGGGRGRGETDAEAGIGAAEGAVGAVEEDVGFADGAAMLAVQGGEAGADGVVGVELEFEFDFEGHGVM